MAQNTVLEALARVAATLREAELRTLLHLLACVGEGGTCRVSSRQIAEATGQGRKTVQVALDGLQERGLVESDGGSATRAAMLTLRFLRRVAAGCGLLRLVFAVRCGLVTAC